MFLNYHDFLQSAPEVLENQHNSDKKNAVLLVEFEKLPQFDGIFGFNTVDKVMQQVSEQLNNALNMTDLVGLTSRNQICCLLVDLLTDAHAMLAAHKILRILTKPLLINQRRILLYPRIGVALNSKNKLELDLLMSNASLALYHAAHDQESIKMFVEGEKNLLLSRMDLWSDLGHAIEEGQLSIAYQPQYSIADEKIKSTEALLRWEHPSYGNIQPSKMIQVAEGTELITKLSLWVYNTALRQCAEYRKAGLTAGVSINFSANDLRDPELLDLVSQGLSIWGVPPDAVVIELTETAVMENQPGSLETLHQLKDIGFKLAMDDFGTGYSSMQRLLELPLDEIKIDMTFVRNMISQPTHERIVESMINLGHKLSLSVVAEGVEDYATFERLKNLNCDIIQGYFIGQGMPLPDLVKTFINQSNHLPIIPPQETQF